MIDTHTHLYLPEFADGDGGGSAAVRRALAAGVTHLIFPNVDLTTVEPMHRLAADFPDKVSCAMGLHPTEVNDDWRPALDRVVELAETGSYVAIGEVGIDLYWDATFREQQMQALEQQGRLAKRLGLPMIIHCREGLAECVETLSGVPGIRGVFHSFGGTDDDVELIRKRLGDWYFGINGIVTFKNSKLRRTLPAIGIDRLLLETDSPYLAPVPHRGKRNESAYLPCICAHIADSMGLDAAEVDEITTRSARTLFNLSQTK